MSDTSKAVFLSCESRNEDAAKRLGDGLRAAGIEVWFDPGELRGGDAWDTKIRGQIKSCALFIPVVSTGTEERDEGNFRREWKLATDRTNEMAGGRAFIVPVVIDATPEPGAVVPAEFTRYQWVHLPGGGPSPEFVDQIRHLLEAPRHKPALKPSLPRPPTLPPEFREAAKAKAAAVQAPAKKSGGHAGRRVALIVVLLAVATVVYYFLA